MKNLKYFLIPLLLGLMATGAFLGHARGDGGSRVYLPQLQRPLPDQLAFTNLDNQGIGLYVLNNDDAMQLNHAVPSGDINTNYAWSPIGAKLLFAKVTGGYDSDVFVVNWDGSGLKNLTNNSGAENDDPVWSPDGANIAYTAKYSGSFQIQLMKPDGTHPITITSMTGDSFEPFWSPNGQRLAFTYYPKNSPASQAEIYAIDPDGTHLVRLTNNAYTDSIIQWSPDGAQLLFRSQTLDANFTSDIYVMDADGRNLHALSSSGHSFVAAWSRDDARIAVSDDTSTYLINPDGSGKTELKCQDSSFNAGSISWSPSGDFLAFTLGYGNAHRDLYFIYPASNSCYQPIYNQMGELNDVQWRP